MSGSQKISTGPDLIEFVSRDLFPYLQGFKRRATGPDTVEYKQRDRGVGHQVTRFIRARMSSTHPANFLKPVIFAFPKLLRSPFEKTWPALAAGVALLEDVERCAARCYCLGYGRIWTDDGKS